MADYYGSRFRGVRAKNFSGIPLVMRQGGWVTRDRAAEIDADEAARKAEKNSGQQQEMVGAGAPSSSKTN